SRRLPVGDDGGCRSGYGGKRRAQRRTRHRFEAAQKEKAFEALVDHLVEAGADLDLLAKAPLGRLHIKQTGKFSQLLTRLGPRGGALCLLLVGIELERVHDEVENMTVRSLRKTQDGETVSAPDKAGDICDDVL